MIMKITVHTIAMVAALATATSAQSVLFDFNNAPLHTSLPIDQTAGGITAHLSATGQGYSIQDTSAPVVPIGFTGRFIYPNSIYAADLLISFDRTLSDFSILYSPQELGCDDSCTMRVTASMNGSFVGTATHTATTPGTWPVDTLSCSFPQGFNSVVVHYDSPPPHCTDYGVIFLADDMRVSVMGNSGTPFCFGDGSGTACPCSNTGSSGHGCENSSATGGARLVANGTTNPDTMILSAFGEKPSALSVFFQGTTSEAPIHYGDGLRCVGGTFRRLYSKNASGGQAQAPQSGELSITMRSAALGDPIPSGSTRYYFVSYRDPDPTFCPSPPGGTFNVTNALSIVW
jgi:hypothetical protein